MDAVCPSCFFDDWHQYVGITADGHQVFECGRCGAEFPSISDGVVD